MMKATVEQISLPLSAPLVSSSATVDHRELLLLCLEGEHGMIGWGEAAPLEPFDGVSLERCETALESQLGALCGAPDGVTGSELLELCRAADPLPQALAAVDVALWDLAGQREGRPLAELLATKPLARVAVNAVIGADPPAVCADQARVAVAAGYRTIKVKVGTDADVERLKAIRAAVGSEVKIRIDANGAWTVAQAAAQLEAFAPIGIEFAEQPVSTIDELRQLSQLTTTPLAIDESVAQEGALASGAADLVCLKVGRAGGISPLLAQAALVRSSGAELFVASMLDGPIGIAAALHCAAALRPERACGLATLDRFDGLDGGLLAPVGGEIIVPLGAGLGVGPTEA